MKASCLIKIFFSLLTFLYEFSKSVMEPRTYELRPVRRPVTRSSVLPEDGESQVTLSTCSQPRSESSNRGVGPVSLDTMQNTVSYFHHKKWNRIELKYVLKCCFMAILCHLPVSQLSCFLGPNHCSSDIVGGLHSTQRVFLLANTHQQACCFLWYARKYLIYRFTCL